MALTMGTISGTFLRPDLGSGAMTVYVEAATDGSRLTYNSSVIAGKYHVNIAGDGTAMVTLPLLPQALMLPADARWRMVMLIGKDIYKKEFTLSGDTTWGALVDVSETPLTSSLVDRAEAAAADAEASAAAAAASGGGGLAVMTYAGSVGVARPASVLTIWEGFPSQPTNMVSNDIWMAAGGGALLSGTAAPTGADGYDGDVYIRTGASATVYGPKASGSWPTGTSMIGVGITSIARTSGTGSPGSTDTYTITYSNSTTSTFTVYNGTNGAGSNVVVQDEGGTLATNGTTLNFVGGGITASGTGATKTISVPVAKTGKFLLPSGAGGSTYNRLATAMATQTGVSGQLYMTAVELAAGEVVTSLTYKVGGSSGSGTVTHSWMGVWDAGLVCRAISADSTATMAISTPITFNMGSAYTVPSDGLYFFGLMIASATPSFVAPSPSTPGINVAPVLSGLSGGATQTTPPATSSTATALTSGLGPWMWWS